MQYVECILVGAALSGWKLAPKSQRFPTSSWRLAQLLLGDVGHEKWGVDPEKVKLIEYNLLANQGSEFNVSGAEIENFKTYVAGSIADMKIEDEQVRAGCNFRKVCDL